MIPEQKYSVIIVAGGKGLRAGGSEPKQFQLIGEKPMLMHTIEAFFRANRRIRIIIVLPEGFDEYWHNLCQKYQFDIEHIVVQGGETRFHSVKNGLSHVSGEETVGVHDAARPFVSEKLIKTCFDTSFSNHCGVIPATDEKNSVRILKENGSKIIDRSLLKIIQTPQVFPAEELKEAYQIAFNDRFTDDASVAEANGMEITLVKGEETNIKITTAFDLEIAELYLRKITNR